MGFTIFPYSIDCVLLGADFFPVIRISVLDALKHITPAMAVSLIDSCVETHGADFSVNLLECVHDGSQAVSTNRAVGIMPKFFYCSHNCSTLIQARDDLISGVDTFYLLYAGSLVFFMQIGFALLCAGSIREKNVKNVLLWCLLDSSGGALGYWAMGYAIAYGGDDASKDKTFVGNSGFFLTTPDIDLGFWCMLYHSDIP